MLDWLVGCPTACSGLISSPLERLPLEIHNATATAAVAAGHVLTAVVAWHRLMGIVSQAMSGANLFDLTGERAVVIGGPGVLGRAFSTVTT